LEELWKICRSCNFAAEAEDWQPTMTLMAEEQVDDSEVSGGDLQARCKVLQSLKTAYLSKAFCHIKINVREYKYGNILWFVS